MRLSREVLGYATVIALLVLYMVLNAQMYVKVWQHDSWIQQVENNTKIDAGVNQALQNMQKRQQQAQQGQSKE